MSNQNITTHKFVAILNKKLTDPGKLLNALGHMSLGLVAAYPDQIENMGFVDYIDKDGNKHKSLSKNSYVILKADNSNQIRTVRNAAIEQNICFVDFTSTMQEGTYLEQLEKTVQVPELELEYYGIVLFGDIPTVSEITRKFGLWR